MSAVNTAILQYGNVSVVALERKFTYAPPVAKGCMAS